MIDIHTYKTHPCHTIFRPRAHSQTLPLAINISQRVASDNPLTIHTHQTVCDARKPSLSPKPYYVKSRCRESRCRLTRSDHRHVKGKASLIKTSPPLTLRERFTLVTDKAFSITLFFLSQRFILSTATVFLKINAHVIEKIYSARTGFFKKKTFT